jgi:aldose sugar dehydrogenase
VALDRGYAQNGTIYFCFAEPIVGGGRTSLARARPVDEGISGALLMSRKAQKISPPTS